MIDLKIVKPIHKIKFMGQTVETRELTMKDIKNLEENTKGMQSRGIDEIHKLITLSIVGMEDATLDYLDDFPIRSLLELQDEIMKVNKLGDKGKK